jgi:hypothetical protein
MGKSKFIQHIAQILPNAYSTSKPNPTSVDHKIAMGNIFIHELEEIETLLERWSESDMKAFLTERKIMERKKYAAEEESITPRTNFIGTTNKEMLLNDPTGNRRFFMVNVTDIDHGYLAIDPVMFWGELVHRYQQGERGLLTMPEREYQARANATAKVYTALHEVLERLFVFTKDEKDGMQLTDIKLTIKNSVYGEPFKERELTHTLTDLGATSGRFYDGGQQKRGWLGIRLRKHNEIDMPNGSTAIKLGSFGKTHYVSTDDIEDAAPEPEPAPIVIEPQKSVLELDENDIPLPPPPAPPADGDLPSNARFYAEWREDRNKYAIIDKSNNGVDRYYPTYQQVLNFFNEQPRGNLTF